MGTWEFRIPEIVLFRIARGRGLNNHDKTHLALVSLTTVTRVRPRCRKKCDHKPISCPYITEISTSFG